MVPTAFVHSYGIVAKLRIFFAEQIAFLGYFLFSSAYIADLIAWRAAARI